MTADVAVRTRVAPSPTGDPHVGTAYTALFNWVFARSQGGQFVLRIEDTDQARSTASSEQMILDALAWAGITWDEGPDVGGDFGPYRQSERQALYLRHAHELVDKGHAFRCFCTPERLDAMRHAQQKRGENPRYDGLCQALTPDEISTRINAGEPHVIRMKVPHEGTSLFNDVLRGPIEIPWSQIDMQVLIKADGFPTYHLAVVVDDHYMQISHVLRGDEWISSVPKHQLLYEYFGWTMPVHAHLPLLRNPDHSKLSKRKNPTSLNYYRRIGYLPEALLNYLGLMGWSMPDEREIFTVEEMVEAFDLARVSTGGPIFDFEKLDWLNGQYIRQLDPDTFIDRVAEWALNRTHLAPLVPLVQERTERLADLVAQVDYLVGDRPPITVAHFEHKTMNVDACKRVLDHVLRHFDALRTWERDEIFTFSKTLADAMGYKIRDFLFPLFIAISGRTVALPLFDSLVFLGPDVTRVRLRSAIDVLGGISKKEGKRFEKAFRELQLEAS